MPYPVLACAIVFFWSISARSVFYTLLPAVAVAYALTTGEGATLASAMLLGYSAGLWLTPFLGGGRARLILAGLVISVAASLALALAPNPVLVALGAFAIGFGAGCYLPQGMAIITEASGPTNRARYMGYHEVAAAVGAFAGAAYVGAVVESVGWSAAIAAWSVFGLVGAAAVVPLLRRERAADARQGARSADVPFRPDAVFGACVASYASINVLLAGLISVMTLLMVRVWGADAGWAANVVGWTRLAGLIGVAAAAIWGDRVGPGRMLFAMYVVSVAGTVLMAVAPLGPAFVLGLALTSAGSSGSILLFVVVMAAGYAPAQRAKAIGIASALAGLIGNVAGPWAFGHLIDAGLDRAPFWLAAAGTMLALALLRPIRERSARPLQPAEAT